VTRATGHLNDHPEVVKRRAGLHMHPAAPVIFTLVSALPLATTNRAFVPVSKGGPGILDQDGVGACFPASTPILLADGTERAIEDIGEGNEVRTHNGKRRRVTRVMRRQYEGTLHTITLHGYVYPTTMTEEHPVGVVLNGHARPKWEYAAGEIAWTAAKDVKPGDYILMPADMRPSEPQAPQTLRVVDYISDDCLEVDGIVRCFSAHRKSVIPAKIVADARFARLLGLFLAEGCYEKSAGSPSGVNFTFARHEQEYQQEVVDALKSIFGVAATVEAGEKRPSVTDISVHNETIAKFFFGLCGEGALTKRLPTFLFTSPREVRLAVLRGWLEGDGTQGILQDYRRSIQIHGSTSSEILHRALFRLALSCGLKPGCQQRAQEDHQNAPPGSLYFYGNDALEIFPQFRAIAEEQGVKPNGKRVRLSVHPHGFACKVKSVAVSATEEPIEVYNFEVDEEHTYIANGMAVHNCEGFAHGSGGTIDLAVQGKSQGLISPSLLYLGALLFDQGFNADGTLTAVTDTGTMPSSILSAWRTFGALLAANDDQYPISQQVLYQDPSNQNSPLILPPPEKLYASSPYRFNGAYFITTQGPARLLQAMAVLAAGHPISNAICASGPEFQGYRGGIMGMLSGPIDHANLIVDYEWIGTVADFATFVTALQQGSTSTIAALSKYLILHCINSWSEGWGEGDAVATVSGGMYRASTVYFDQAADLCTLDISAAA
jgi:intein/homing endonuclease